MEQQYPKFKSLQCHVWGASFRSPFIDILSLLFFYMSLIFMSMRHYLYHFFSLVVIHHLALLSNCLKPIFSGLLGWCMTTSSVSTSSARDQKRTTRAVDNDLRDAMIREMFVAEPGK